MSIPNFRTTRALSTLLLFAALGCDDDPTQPDGGEPREYAIVLNSVSASVTVFPVEETDSTHTIALEPSSTPTTLAVRDDIALVPLGVYPAVAVIDLDAGVVIDEIPLPAGSGATGVAIVSDSLAFVANPDLNSVTPVYYRTGETGDAIDVGVYPTSLLALGNLVFVVEANLVSFMPAGPSTVSVIDAATLEVNADFVLSGKNAAQAATDGAELYVVQAGNWDSTNAGVSEIDLPVAAEVDFHTGFATFASEIAVALDGTILVSSPFYGVAHYDPNDEDFLVEPGEGVGAAGMNVLGIGLDTSDRLWVIDAGDCASPGRAVLVTGSNGVVVDEATVEVCPEAIEFSIF